MTNTNPDTNPSPPTKRQTDQQAAHETYLAPPPPKKGKIVGLDCHPDTFTAAVFRGTTPHDAVKLASRPDMSLDALLAWAKKNFTRDDLFLLEASANSFEIHRRLLELGLRAAVMESAHVGKHAKTYADNDKMAAARIALVFLQGNAPCVWIPDPRTRERRELLKAYQNAVSNHVAAINELKGYLNQYAIRPGSQRHLENEKAEQWILRQRDWAPLQLSLLQDRLTQLRTQSQRRKDLYQLIAREIATEPLMLRCMRLLGIGLINAFALLAIIGDVGRFERPEKLVAYLGLNPGQRESGRGKHIKLGVGKRGRGDMRGLLIQAAQAVLRTGSRTPLGQWGMKLFLRKGNRNIAVVAVARKLAVQVWHELMGHPPVALEADKSLDLKLSRLCQTLGKNLRATLGLSGTVAECIEYFRRCITTQVPLDAPMSLPPA